MLEVFFTPVASSEQLEMLARAVDMEFARRAKAIIVGMSTPPVIQDRDDAA